MKHLVRAPIQTGHHASCPLLSYHPHVWVLPPSLHYLISSPIYLFIIKSSDRAARHTHTLHLVSSFGFHELAAGRMFLLEMLLPLSFSRDLAFSLDSIPLCYVWKRGTAAALQKRKSPSKEKTLYAESSPDSIRPSSGQEMFHSFHSAGRLNDFLNSRQFEDVEGGLLAS